MNKSVSAAVLGLILFLVTYCLCFWFQIMPKFYPKLGLVTVANLEGQIAVKFVGAALVGILVGLIGLIVGRRLPERWARRAHLVVWLVMIAGCIYLVGREGSEYIWGG